MLAPLSRTFLFECKTGSHLYGTNRPDSDEDFTGIFMPTRSDLLGLSTGTQEMSLDKKLSDGIRNTKGDTDRKFYSVQKFLKLAADGQSQMLEMLFSPQSLWKIDSPIWLKIHEMRHEFLSQKSIVPFLGFATAQAHKATLKAENLIKIRAIISAIESLRDGRIRGSFFSPIENCINDNKLIGIPVDIVEVEYRPGVMIKCVEIAGRKIEFTQNLKTLYNRLKELESRYGSRSEAAAIAGFDFKSLSHAYRLLFEAEDILKYNRLFLPFNKERVAFLLSVRSGEYKADYFTELESKIQDIKNINSSLPNTVNYDNINNLCEEILFEGLKMGKNP